MKIIEGKDLVNMKFIKTEDGLLKEYKPQGRFIPNDGNTYWFVNIYGDLIYNCNANDKKDKYLIAHNLVFRTIKECEDYRWFLEQLNKYKTDFSKEEWEDFGIEKHYLCFDHRTKEVELYIAYNVQDQRGIYFTKDDIEKFVEVVGKERIKKYLFDIWE